MAEICLGYSFFRDTTRQSDNKEPKTETCAELDKKTNRRGKPVSQMSRENDVKQKRVCQNSLWWLKFKIKVVNFGIFIPLY